MGKAGLSDAIVSARHAGWRYASVRGYEPTILESFHGGVEGGLLDRVVAVADRSDALGEFVRI